MQGMSSKAPDTATEFTSGLVLSLTQQLGADVAGTGPAAEGHYAPQDELMSPLQLGFVSWL